MNTEEAFLLTIVILLTVIMIWFWITISLWISKRLRIPVVVVIFISFFTGGLGFLFMLLLALLKEDSYLEEEVRSKKKTRVKSVKK